MNIFSNLVNGSVNYKKIVDDYMAKDRSVTASYGRNHINRPTQGYLGLLLLVAFVGLISFAFGSGESFESAGFKEGTAEELENDDIFGDFEASEEPDLL